MAWNNIVQGYMQGQSEFGVTFEQPPPEPPPDPQPYAEVEGESFLWTIHPKRRLNANVDTRRKRLAFGRLSINSDFRPWQRILRYTKKVVDWLCPDPDLFTQKTYGEWKATGATYAEIKCNQLPYGDLKGEMPV